MFIDRATAQVQAGRGGDGRVSFLRNRHQPKGGPDGGDGGHGGNVIVRASHNSSTLSKYRVKTLWKAEAGTAGGTNKRHGKNGADLTLIVPPGTIVRDGDTILADLVHDGDEAIVAKGGRGGLGNTHFATSTFQAPKFAELGAPGGEKELTLELKLIADVGLVGLPNAGKSTLLSVITSARPKIADYAFTTLVPNLGVARFDKAEFVVADIPGLIEGASEGKGLGDDFLRHVERTRVLIHLVDATDQDVAESYRIIRDELVAYAPELAHRPTLVVLSKRAFVDEATAKVKRKALARAAKCKMAEVLELSAQEHQGLQELLALTAHTLQVTPEIAPEVDPNEIIDIPVESVVDWYLEPAGKDRYILKGRIAERWGDRTNFQQSQAVERLRSSMSRAGVFRRLKQLDAREGHTIIEVNGQEMTW